MGAAHRPRKEVIVRMGMLLRQWFNYNLASGDVVGSDNVRREQHVEDSHMRFQSRRRRGDQGGAGRRTKLMQKQRKLQALARALAVDEEFLAMLKEKCLGTDAEWEERQKIRQREMRHAPRLWQS